MVIVAGGGGIEPFERVADISRLPPVGNLVSAC